MAKRTEYVYDHAAGRWRKGGRWAKAPSRRQLRTDKRGRYIDAAGKRVPKTAIAEGAAPTVKPSKKTKSSKTKAKPKAGSRPAKLQGPKKGKSPKKPAKKLPDKRKPKPKSSRPTRKPRKRTRKQRIYGPIQAPLPPGLPSVQTVRKRVRYVPEGGLISPRLLFSTQFANRAPPTYAGDTLYNAIGRTSTKSPITADDVLLYQFGVQFVHTAGFMSDSKTEKFVKELAREYPEFRFSYNGNHVYALLGDVQVPISREDARNKLREYSAQLESMWNALYDHWDGDIGWFAIADNDEIDKYE